MPAVLKRYVRFDPGTALPGTFHKGMMLPVVKENVHIGTVETVGKIVNVKLDI